MRKLNPRAAQFRTRRETLLPRAMLLAVLTKAIEALKAIDRLEQANGLGQARGRGQTAGGTAKSPK